MLKELAEQTPEYDVLVVSDGSTDRTAELARRVGRARRRAAVQPRHRWRAAHRVHVRGAARLRARGPVRRRRPARPARGERAARGPRPRRRHGDRQPVRRGRRGHLRGERPPAARDEAAAVARAACSSASTSPTPAPGSASFSRPMLEFFADSYPVEYMDSVEALVLACNAGFRVEEVPVNMRGRTGGAPSHAQLQARLLLRAPARGAAGVDDEPRPTGPAHRQARR